MFPDRRRPKRKKAPRAAVSALLDRDLALHSGQVGQAADLLLVVAGKAGASAESDAARGAGRDHSRLRADELRETLANFLLQLFEKHKLTRSFCHGSMQLRPLPGRSDHRPGAHAVDHRPNAELLVDTGRGAGSGEL